MLAFTAILALLSPLIIARKILLMTPLVSRSNALFSARIAELLAENPANQVTIYGAQVSTEIDMFDRVACVF